LRSLENFFIALKMEVPGGDELVFQELVSDDFFLADFIYAQILQVISDVSSFNSFRVDLNVRIAVDNQESNSLGQLNSNQFLRNLS